MKILQILLLLGTLAQTAANKAAVVNGETISEAQVAKAAAANIQKLGKSAAMWQALDAIIAAKVLAIEAQKSGMTKDELVWAEIDSDRPQPPDQVVEIYYETNKARFPGPKPAALEKVRKLLADRSRTTAYDAYVKKLSRQYGVKIFLDPLRKTIATTGYPSRGPANAPITIVEFSDFECPYCNALIPTMKTVQTTYGDKVRIVYRQFPLPWVHPHALKAAEASLCANQQNKFWEFHDALFANQKGLAVEDLKKRAAELKLDSSAFNTCLDSGRYAAAVRKDMDEGNQAGVGGTPTVFINGRLLYGTQAFADVKEIIDDELRRQK